MIKLKVPLKFTKEIQAIELPQPETEPTGIAYLCGWGLFVSSHNILSDPDKLQHIKLTYIDRDTCSIFVENQLGFSLIDENNICTGPLTGGISACDVRMERERER